MPEILESLEKYLLMLDGGIIRLEFIPGTDSYREIKRMLRGKKRELKERILGKRI